MKIRLRNLFIYFTLLTFLASCEKELYDDSIRTSQRAVKSEFVTGNEAKLIISKLEKSLKKKFTISDASASRISITSIGTIRYDEIVKVTDSTGKSTYTFKVEHPESSISKFFNLILQEKADGNILKLMEYTMSQEFAQQFAETLNYKDFRGTLTTYTIINETPCPDEDIFVVTIGQIGGTPSGVSGPGDTSGGNPTGGNTTGGNNTGGNNSSGSPTDGNPTGGNPTEGNPNGGNNGTGGEDLALEYLEMIIECIESGGTWNYTDGNCIANPRYFKMTIDPVGTIDDETPCDPSFCFVVMTPYTECERDFMLSCSQDLKTWLYQNINTDEYVEIMTMINEDCSPEKRNLASELVREMKRGSEIDFQNKIIVDSSFVHNQKANCVYNKMKNNMGFKTFTQPFNIDNPVAFVKLKVGAVEDNDRAQTLPPDSNNIIEITINNDPTHPNGINSQPNLFLCQTIIHEVVHAEFFRRIIEALGSNPSGQTLQTIIDALNKSKYQVLANYLISSNVWPDWPHNYMAEKFRKSIARVTQEYATGIPVNGEPEIIYMSYAWRGLDQIDVQAWMQISPEVQTNIQDAIDDYISNNSNQTCQ